MADERFFVADIPEWSFWFVQQANPLLSFDREVVERLIDLAIRQVTQRPRGLILLDAFYSMYGVVPTLYETESRTLEGLLECWATGMVSVAGWNMIHGVWDHFKGGIYMSDRVDRDADTGNPRVSYRSLIFGTSHSRRAEQWNEVVQWPDGKYRSRFIYRGPDGSPEPEFKVPSPVPA